MEDRKPEAPIASPRPARRDLDNWRGDVREQPPAWRRRPRREMARQLWNAARPLIDRIGEGQSWS